MSYNDALQLFNLHPNYTEKELETRYKILKIRKKHGSLSKRSLFNLNKAYYILKKEFKKNNEKVELYKLEILEEIKKHFFAHTRIDDVDFNYHYDAENKIIKKGINNIEIANTIEEIVCVISELNRKVAFNNIAFYNKYIQKYKEVKKIPNKIIFEYRKKIEKAPNIISAYQITCELINKFQNIQNSKINIEEIVETNLNIIIYSFKNSKNFEYIKPIVLKLKEKAKEQILIENSIVDVVVYEKFRSDISNLIKIYNKKNLDLYKVYKFERMIEKYNPNKLCDLTLKENIKRLVSLAGTDKFNIVYDALNKKMVLDFSRIEIDKISITELRQIIKNKYKYIVNSTNIKGTINSKKELKFIENILYLLEKIENKQLSLRQIELVKILFYSDTVFDKEILNMVLFGKKINHDIVFLERNPNKILTNQVKVEEISEEKLFYTNDNKQSVDTKITSFKEEYISLLDFLEQSKYVGKKVVFYDVEELENKQYLLLYQNIDFSLLYDEKKADFIIINNFSIEKHKYRICEDIEIENKFKDIYYIYKIYINSISDLYSKKDIKIKTYK